LRANAEAFSAGDQGGSQSCPEVPFAGVCGGIALAEIDREQRASVDRTPQLPDCQLHRTYPEMALWEAHAGERDEVGKQPESRRPSRFSCDYTASHDQLEETAARSRKDASFAAALNCGIGSSSLNALVNAFERLHVVRGANSSRYGFNAECIVTQSLLLTGRARLSL
jgi:hypothetical protein